MSDVLIDTSVWIDHFRRRKDDLAELIGNDRGLVHPMIIIELACGNLPAPRERTLRYLSVLRTCTQAALGEVRDFIEREQLFGLGCGLVDITLLASTLITPGSVLWTLDKRLYELTVRFGVAYRPDVS